MKDPNLIAIQLYSNEYMLLVWNVDKNQEYRNFSFSSMQEIFLSKWSKTGILIWNNFYIDIDKGAINYYFNSDISTTGINGGYKLNSFQNMLINETYCYWKESIAGWLNYWELLFINFFKI